ncbi:MAG: YfiR family protein [Candidatus Riflebacteria bacterium]|nr:YfiR family protein [Candidatus Riflebacteria bacterium]
MSTRRLGILLSGLWLALALAGPGRAADDLLEAKVKTAYIFNLLPFAEWTAEPAENRQLPIRIAVAGADPVGDLLEELANAPMEGRGLKVERLPDAAPPDPGVHLLFISRSAEKHLSDLLQNLEGRNVLTISDIPQFARRGGAIGFLKEGGRIRLEINLGTVKRLGWKIQAKLLEVARVIREERP